MSAYDQFQKHVASINDLFNTINILNWDARTQMPAGGSQTRAYQLATLAEIAQQRFASETTARLLDAAEAELSGADPDSYALRAVRQTREAYRIALRIPPSLAAEMAEYEPVAQSVWGEARAKSDYALFAPYLKRMVTMQRRLADAIGYSAHPYDALLVRYEPGMTAARLKALFAELSGTLRPLIARAGALPAPRADFLERDYPESDQRAFGLSIARAFGYDLRRGRLDIAAHPFEVSFTREDVRITTRYKRNYLPGAIFGVFHETGHALYEQGVDPALTRTALTTDFLGQYAVGGTSYGAHESQSRLWENLVGRSRPFWQHHFADLRATFIPQLSDVDAEEFYRAVNKVQPSTIRVEADEVTYNFHIMLRVEIEMAMLDGSLAVNDVAEHWRAKMQEYLGVTPPDDAQGALQDVHWSSGSFGTFCTYSIGNIMSVQLFEAARRGVAGLDAALAAGDYAPLLAWLTENMYRHGRTFSAEEILQRATGQGLTTAPYLGYLNRKFGELYPA